LRSYPWLSGTNRSGIRRLPTASSIVSYITLIAWSYAVSPYAKQKLSASNPKPTILLLPNRSSRSRDAGDKGAQMEPLSPAPQIPALPVKLCSNQLPNLLSNQRLVSVASLRSDYLIGINRNADRHHAGTLIDFPGIRTRFQSSL